MKLGGKRSEILKGFLIVINNQQLNNEKVCLLTDFIIIVNNQQLNNKKCFATSPS